MKDVEESWLMRMSIDKKVNWLMRKLIDEKGQIYGFDPIRTYGQTILIVKLLSQLKRYKYFLGVVLTFHYANYHGVYSHYDWLTDLTNWLTNWLTNIRILLVVKSLSRLKRYIYFLGVVLTFHYANYHGVYSHLLSSITSATLHYIISSIHCV